MMAAGKTEHVDELLPGYAAGAADGAERALVEAHLPGCPRCRLALDDYMAAVHSLALLAPQVDPPLRVRSALLQALPRRRALAFPWTIAAGAGVAAGVLLALALGLGLAVLDLRSEMRESKEATTRLEEMMRQDRLVAYLAASPETEVYVLKPAREGDRSYAMLMGPPSGRFALLLGGGLSNPGSGRVYQVWLSVGGERMSGGTFAVDESGWGRVRVEPPAPFSQVQRVGITVEPAGGSLTPTSDPVLVWARP